MLVAVSGAQGVGKTTLLNEIAMLDYTVDPFKVSRTVQKEMGFASLEEAVVSFESMKRFQENVIQRKYEHDSLLAKKAKNDVVFVERSFYDILAYAERWVAKFEHLHSSVSEWLSGYRQACIKFQKDVYDGLVLIEPNDAIQFEVDHERADESSQRAVDARLKELCSYSEVPVQYVYDHNIKSRVDTVVRFTCKL